MYSYFHAINRVRHRRGDVSAKGGLGLRRIHYYVEVAPIGDATTASGMAMHKGLGGMNNTRVTYHMCHCRQSVDHPFSHVQVHIAPSPHADRTNNTILSKYTSVWRGQCMYVSMFYVPMYEILCHSTVMQCKLTEQAQALHGVVDSFAHILPLGGDVVHVQPGILPAYSRYFHSISALQGTHTYGPQSLTRESWNVRVRRNYNLFSINNARVWCTPKHNDI